MLTHTLSTILAKLPMNKDEVDELIEYHPEFYTRFDVGANFTWSEHEVEKTIVRSMELLTSLEVPLTALMLITYALYDAYTTSTIESGLNDKASAVLFQLTKNVINAGSNMYLVESEDSAPYTPVISPMLYEYPTGSDTTSGWLIIIR